MRLHPGQVAVVTGGASGIGLGLGLELARRGLRVVLADVRPDALDRATAELVESGAEAIGELVDVSDAAAVDRLAAATLERFGRVDLVCNNAGVVGPSAPSWQQHLAVWRWTIDVALMGVVHGVRAFVPHLVRQGTGHVLNTASVGGLVPLPGLAPYNAAKSAVIGFTETLRAELRQHAPGVGATVLCPGVVLTSLPESSRANAPGGVELPVTSMADITGRCVLTPQEVAVAALAGVEDDRAHVVPSEDSPGPVRARIDALLADLDVP